MNLVSFLPYIASILFSCIMAIIYRRFLGSRHLSILLPFLLYVFIQEAFIGFYHLRNNSIVYNIYKPISVIVPAYIYYSIPFMQPFRKLIVSITILYLIITILDYIFIESIFINSSYLALARGFVITFLAILFLFRYFNIDNVTEEKYWRPLIWITTGLIVFYPVISISLTFQKFLLAENATLFNQKLYQLIPRIMSIFMYSCFSYAFYLCRQIK